MLENGHRCHLRPLAEVNKQARKNIVEKIVRTKALSQETDMMIPYYVPSVAFQLKILKLHLLVFSLLLLKAVPLLHIGERFKSGSYH